MRNKFISKIRYGAVGFFLLAAASPAAGQVAFDTCADVTDTPISHSGGDGSPFNSSFTINTLVSTDVVTFSMVFSAGGPMNIGVTDPSGGAIINQTLDADDYSSSHVYPGADMTGAEYSITVTHAPGQDSHVEFRISCSPIATQVPNAFLHERMNLLVDREPDRPRMVRKRLGALWGEDNRGNENTGNENTDTVNLRASRFNVSQNDIKANFSARDFVFADKIDDPAPTDSERGCWDLWGEAHYTRFTDAGSRSGDFAIGYLGIDCQIHASAIAGVLVEIDRMNDKIDSVDSVASGTGWMVGPYATVRLTPNLYFDARAAWGRSDNSVSTAGVTGDFDTEIWLVHARLTGNFLRDDYRITPEVSVSYIEEARDAFVNSAGNSIAAYTAGLGRLKFGPEIAKRILTSSGNYVEPFVSLNGVWDFYNTNVAVGNTTYSNDLRGMVKAGIILRKPNGINFRLAAKYDGIGAGSYSAYGGEFWLNIPLN